MILNYEKSEHYYRNKEIKSKSFGLKKIGKRINRLKT